jgi:hypothetical protein
VEEKRREVIGRAGIEVFAVKNRTPIPSRSGGQEAVEESFIDDAGTRIY